ncbi:MAG: peptide chain release factor N(5)-glutamine methyltransferase [Alphaproteobacteria bacterium]|nr:peptide chain release factor N(5)-glutamine methyltransferase [Alphaproteobacteria bacterium]
MTLAEWRKAIEEAMIQAGMSQASQEAKWLLGAAINRDGAFVTLNPAYIPTFAEEKIIQDWLTRRLEREPLSRIKGMREFWSLAFQLNEHTLDPRPESELIVEAVLKWIGPRTNEPWRILDLGTGSGCLLISLLHELKNASGVGVDIEEKALSMAQNNAELNDVLPRAHFQISNWGEGIREKFDIIVSNPPYIPLQEKEALEKAVLTYDPPQALFGGEDGLDCYALLAKAIPFRLASGGLVVLEIGMGQSGSVTSLFQEQGFQCLFILKDLQGIERTVAFEMNSILKSQLQNSRCHPRGGGDPGGYK